MHLYVCYYWSVRWSSTKPYNFLTIDPSILQCQNNGDKITGLRRSGDCTCRLQLHRAYSFVWTGFDWYGVEAHTCSTKCNLLVVFLFSFQSSVCGALIHAMPANWVFAVSWFLLLCQVMCAFSAFWCRTHLHVFWMNPGIVRFTEGEADGCRSSIHPHVLSSKQGPITAYSIDLILLLVVLLFKLSQIHSQCSQTNHQDNIVNGGRALVISPDIDMRGGQSEKSSLMTSCVCSSAGTPIRWHAFHDFYLHPISTSSLPPN